MYAQKCTCTKLRVDQTPPNPDFSTTPKFQQIRILCNVFLVYDTTKVMTLTLYYSFLPATFRQKYMREKT
jgi:hypothetical protein